MKDMLPAYKPDAELTMMQAVLDNAEIQHTILEKLPLLAAFDGFKQITGRRLDAEGVRK
eukprot:evm.model.NODE_14087_length_57995_cov_43.650368.3